MSKEYTYDAFISYRHAELDKFVAENLHRQLEAFRLPRNLSKKKSKEEKTRIRRIFRDRDELPIASDLASPIMAALEGSEFLIVICSPRILQSEWCKCEIETFISLHGREHVLAVLIEGEPADSFPPALLVDEKEFTLEDGTTEVRQVAVEPLAADVRGKNKHEIRKKISEEVLRLAAPMFHCGYDDLKQRHREQKIKHTIRVLSLACTFFVLFGGYTLSQNMRIRKQSDQILTQSEEIQAQSVEIQAQSDRISEQYQNILITSLNQSADNAFSLLDEGDRFSAIDMALSALPSDEHPDYPVVERAQYALSRALHVYDNGNLIQSDCVLSHDTNISFMLLSPSGKRILTVDDVGILHIWEASTRKEVYCFTLPVSSSLIYDENDFCFVSDSEIVTVLGNSIIRYDFETAETIWKIEDVFSYSTCYSDDLQYLAVSTGSNLTLYNLSTGEKTYSIDSATLAGETPADTEDPFSMTDVFDTIGTTMTFSEDNSLFAFTTNSFYSSDAGEIVLIDTVKKTLIGTLETYYPDISDMLFYQNKLYLLTNSVNTYEDNNILNLNQHDTCVICYDTNSLKPLWSRSFEGTRMTDAQIVPFGPGYLLAESYGALSLLEMETGELENTVNFATDLVEVTWLKDSKYIRCVTRDGEMSSVDITTGISYSASFISNSNNLSDCIQGSGYLVTLPYQSKQITLFKVLSGSGYVPLFDTDQLYFSIIMNQSCDTLLCTYYNDDFDSVVDVYDYPAGKLRYQIKPTDGFDTVCFGGESDNMIILTEYAQIECYDTITGDLVHTYEFEYSSSTNNSHVNKADGQLDIMKYRNYCTLNLYTGEIIEESDYPESYQNSDKCVATKYNNRIMLCNINEGQLEEFSTDDMSVPVRTFPVNASFIDYLFTDDLNSLLFVVYRNNDIEVYDLSTLTLLSTYTELAFSATRFISCENGGDYLLGNDYSMYHCSANHKVKAFISGARAFDTKEKRLICSNNDGLQTVPLYDLPMLSEEAARQKSE